MNEINGFRIENYNVYKLDVNSKTSTCPLCSEHRKKKQDKCLSVFWDTGLASCNHCGELLQLHTYKKKEVENTYEIPSNIDFNTTLSDKLIKYILSRGIDVKSADRLKIRECKEWMPQTKKEENCICFDYYLNGELINIKYRDGRKNFKLYKGAEKLLYNIDAIRTAKECVLVEGEFDVLAFDTAGVYNVASIPNGFNLKGNINLDYLNNYIEYLDNKETIYLAFDSDKAGIKGREEYIRRIGAERIKLIDFKDCKDANDFLLKYGKEDLKNCISNAKEIKVDGIFLQEDVKESMLFTFNNGKRRGTTTYIKNIDSAWTWREGEVTLWTGYQNEGKTLYLMQLSLIRAFYEDAKVATFSPESLPIDEFYDDLIEMYIGKTSDPHYNNYQMSLQEYKLGEKFVNDNFYLIYPEDDFTLETIFKKTEFLIKKKGVRTLIIDPYNTVHHLMQRGEREDLYISRFMAQLKRFALKHMISIHLVAHQLTARKNPNDEMRYFKPDLNNIKGGGTFADKADNCLFIWRPNRAIDFRDTDVIFGSQKIKKQKLVGHPQEIDSITYDWRSNRYFYNGFNPFDEIDRLRKEGNQEILTLEEIKFNEETGEINYIDNFEKENFEKKDVPF